MTLQEVKHALQHNISIEFYSPGGWLPQGWHPVTLSAIDEDAHHPCVWLHWGISGGTEVKGHKDIATRLRVQTHE